RPFEIDAPMTAGHVPGVPPAVAVLVREVVCGPRVRREHDHNAVHTEPPGPDDERCVTDTAVARGRAQEVETAWPVACAQDAKQRGPIAVCAPVDSDRTCHREPARPNVLLAGTSRGLVRE